MNKMFNYLKENWRVLLALGVFIAVIVFFYTSLTGCNDYVRPVTEDEIISQARMASGKSEYHHVVWRVAYPDAFEEGTPIEEVIDKKIQKALEKQIQELKKKEELSKEERYAKYLTDVEEYGFKSEYRTQIILGNVKGVPEHAKFPERVIVVSKIEEEEINPFDDEYEEDVKTVSETANVSLTQAKAILTNIKSKGYRVTKDEVNTEESVELLWFDGGWDDKYPTTLSWEVVVEGEESNIIVGYDPRGILLTKPIPETGSGYLKETARVKVKFGYFDLKDKFKPKSHEVESLEKELKQKEEELEELKKKVEDEEDTNERDITTVTILDIIFGTVDLETSYMISSGSCVYLGDMEFVDDGRWSYHSRRYGGMDARTGMNSVYLTNAHVANLGWSFQFYVNEAKTVMYIVFPGMPFIKYTGNSDRLGSPAALLVYDGEPIMSPSFDCALLVTTPVSSRKDCYAVLGDSDNVTEGTNIVSTGNPIGYTKFSTKGSISNMNFNMLQTYYADYIFKYLNSQSYDWLINSSFWIDPPIGVGGVSGSAVWALDGTEKGKVVALRNSGIGSACNNFEFISEFVPAELSDIDLPRDLSIMDLNRDNAKHIIKDNGFKTAKFMPITDEFRNKLDPSSCGGRVAGMSACIRINLVKQFLEERGIDAKSLHFEESVDWTK